MNSSTSDAQTRRVAPAAAQSRAYFHTPDGVWPNVLLVLLSALVFYLPNQAQIRIDTGLRGLNTINVLCMLTIWVMVLCQRPKSEPMPLKVPLVGMLVMFTMALFIALVGDASAWVEDVTVYKNTLFYPLLYVLFFFAVRDLRTIRVLLVVTLFVYLTSTVLGIRQALEYGVTAFHDMKRVAAPFGWEVFDANRSAIFFCIHLQLIGAAALFLKSRPMLRTACAVLYALGIFVVFFTYSRQALVILAVLGAIILARKHLLLTLVFGFSLYHYDLWVPEPVVERVQMTTIDPYDFELKKVEQINWDPLVELNKAFLPEARGKQIDFDAKEQGSADDGMSFDVSTESRFILWAGAFELIKRQPWGVGLNRFKRTIGPYVPISMAGKDAHNVFVLFATEAGVLAPVVLLALIGSFIALGLRIAKLEGSESKALGNGIVLATLAAALGSIYGSRFFDGEVMGNFWIVLALGARYALIKEAEARQAALAKGGGQRPRGAYVGPRQPTLPRHQTTRPTPY